MKIHSPLRRFRPQVIGLAVVALMLGTTAACGSDDSEPTAEGGVEEIIVAVGTVNTALAPLYIAEARGYFEDANVKVTLSQSASAVQALTSGQADLSYGGVTGAAIPAKSGKQTSILYATSGGGVTIWTVARPGIDDPADCKRLGTYPEGSSTYAWSNILNDGFKMDADFVPFTEQSARAAALVAGTIDCANGSVSGLQPHVESGEAEWLVRPDDASTLPPNFSEGVTEVGVIAMADVVDERREAFVRFLGALMKASDDLMNDTPEAIAADLKKSPDFGPFDEAALVAAIEAESSVMIPFDGYIDEKAWDATLEFLSLAGLDVTATDPELAYDKIVDMSIYEEAKKQ